MAQQKKRSLEELRAGKAKQEGKGDDAEKREPGALKRFQTRHEPAITSLAAWTRAGREDLLNTLMGGVAGEVREPGMPGVPTAQITTEGLKGQEVDLRTDQVKGAALDDVRGKTSLEDLRGKVPAEAEQSRGMEQQHEHER